MVEIECKVGRYFICSVCRLYIVSAAPSSICLLLVIARRLRTKDDIGDGQEESTKRETEKETISGHLYV